VFSREKQKQKQKQIQKHTISLPNAVLNLGAPALQIWSIKLTAAF
jgi:hypothetical protein